MVRATQIIKFKTKHVKKISDYLMKYVENLFAIIVLSTNVKHIRAIL